MQYYYYSHHVVHCIPRLTYFMTGRSQLLILFPPFPLPFSFQSSSYLSNYCEHMFFPIYAKGDCTECQKVMSQNRSGQTTTCVPNLAHRLFWQIKFYWNTEMLIHFVNVCGYFHSTCGIEQLQQRLHGLYSLKYLLSCPLEKRFSKLCSKISRKGKLQLGRSCNSILYVHMFNICCEISLRIRVAVFSTILNIIQDFGTFVFYI